MLERSGCCCLRGRRACSASRSTATSESSVWYPARLEREAPSIRLAGRRDAGSVVIFQGVVRTRLSIFFHADLGPLCLQYTELADCPGRPVYSDKLAQKKLVVDLDVLPAFTAIFAAQNTVVRRDPALIGAIEKERRRATISPGWFAPSM